MGRKWFVLSTSAPNYLSLDSKTSGRAFVRLFKTSNETSITAASAYLNRVDLHEPELLRAPVRNERSSSQDLRASFCEQTMSQILRGLKLGDERPSSLSPLVVCHLYAMRMLRNVLASLISSRTLMMASA